HGRNRLRSSQGRADRIYQIARARTRPLPHQRQLRLPRPYRYPAVPASARTDEGGADTGDPVSPNRPADRNRAGGDVLFEPRLGLHYRTGAECQRRLDDGRLRRQPLHNRQRRNGRMPSYSSMVPAVVLLLAAAASASAQAPRDPGAAANVRESEQYE